MVHPDHIEQNLLDIFGPEEVAAYRRDRGRNELESSNSDSGESSDASSVWTESSSEDEEMDLGDEARPSVTLESAELWTERPSPTSISFMGIPGEKIGNVASMSPFDYFKLFFNLNFLTRIAQSTNEHAAAIIRSRSVIKPQSRLKAWKNTNPQELLKFLGVLFYMGTVRLSKINAYWTKSHLVKFQMGKYMSRNRFLNILRMLYFEIDNVTGSIYNKVDPLISYFNETMKNIIYPERELTIDESMVQFRGRLNIRQYMKSKRHKFGIKLYVLADPKGIVHKIHMYKGSADTEVGGKGHVQKVVLKLLNDYMGVGHSVYMDNYYNSVDLAEILLSKDTYCTGTLLSNRKRNPRVVTTHRLHRGGNIHRYNGKGVCVMKWKDKRDVLMISTEHTHDMATTYNRRGCAVSKPNMVLQYNKFMKGVDRHDQMLSYYPCDHKTVRWYKKLGIHIMLMMFLNAYLLHKKYVAATMDLDKFRKQVLDAILPPLPTPPPQIISFHMPQELPRSASGTIKRRKCSRCMLLHNRRRDTGLFCGDCNIGLCLACYGPYHSDNGLLARPSSPLSL